MSVFSVNKSVNICWVLLVVVVPVGLSVLCSLYDGEGGIYSIVNPPDFESLEGKTVLLCGGSRGIGRSMALEYAKWGAKVVITSRTTSKLEEVVAIAQKENLKGSIYSVAADLSDMEETKKMVANAKTLLGNKIDILVLNHIRPYFDLFEDTEVEVLENIVSVNLLSYIRITKLLFNDIVKFNTKVIVVSSAAGKIGIPFTAIYSGTKHALHGFFDSLSLELDMFHKDSSASITTCIIGTINTESAVELTKGRLKDRPKASPEATAHAIISGSLQGQREVYFPWHETYLPQWLKIISPSLTRNLVRSAMEPSSSSSS
eukprot:m.237609 g.237609  ORF g.237609 m.237609 type:complete len:317 (-) comp13928_c1_seq1:881-1831(-)